MQMAGNLNYLILRNSGIRSSRTTGNALALIFSSVDSIKPDKNLMLQE